MLLLAICYGITLHAQEVILLYTGQAPGNLSVKDTEVFSTPPGGRPTVKNVTRPTLTVFLPAKPDAARSSVIVCPGGGYLNLSIVDGGYEAAKELAAAGITAFVLKYRTWIEGTYSDYKNVPMMDLQQAMKIVRAGASKWNLDTAHIGLLGFSAGGHLVSMSATSNTGIKPAFTLLIYPVISFMDSLTLPKSKTRGALLGNNITEDQKRAYSPELHVTASTPPAFLVQAEDDSTSTVGNSLIYHKALVTHKVPCQLLVYQKGGHGFALYNKAQDEYWMPAAIKWLRLNGFLH